MSDPHDTGASASPLYTVPTRFESRDAKCCMQSAQPDLLEDLYATTRGLSRYMVHCDAPADHAYVAATLRLIAFGIAGLAVRFTANETPTDSQDGGGMGTGGLLRGVE